MMEARIQTVELSNDFLVPSHFEQFDPVAFGAVKAIAVLPLGISTY